MVSPTRNDSPGTVRWVSTVFNIADWPPAPFANFLTRSIAARSADVRVSGSPSGDSANGWGSSSASVTLAATNRMRDIISDFHNTAVRYTPTVS
jgi:hypothetical protein